MHALKMLSIFNGYFCGRPNTSCATEAVQTMRQHSADIAAFGKRKKVEKGR